MSQTRGYAGIVLIVIAVTLFVALPVSSQELALGVPSAGMPLRSMDFNAFTRGDWLRSLTLGRACLGVFAGGGAFTVAHSVEAGPNHVAALPGIPDFDAFSHMRKTPLTDAFVSLETALTAEGVALLNVRFETNIGRVTQFRQWTEPGVQQPFGFNSRYAVGSVLRLPNNLEGIIFLDNRNRMWTWDVTGRIPGFRGVDILLEYKWSSITSSLDPYSSDNPILGSHTLAPNVGWRNNWTNAVPSTTSFNMAQSFKWNGPFVGLSWRMPASVWAAGGFLDVVASPCVFGKYEFDWGAAYDDGFFFVRGWQGTQISGWNRIGLEARGGITFSLFQSLALDVKGKYTYIRLRDSGTEDQSMSNNFLATQAYVQGAQESLTLTEELWQIGGSLNLLF